MRVRPDLRQAVAAQLAGETPPPPAEQLLGIRLVSSADGGAVFELEVAERHLSPTGAVHGGILATLADGAMATAVVSTLAPEETCLTLELKINFVRAVFAGTLVARGSTIARTRTTGIAECRVTDQDDRLVAHATSTLTIQRRSRRPLADTETQGAPDARA